MFVVSSSANGYRATEDSVASGTPLRGTHEAIDPASCTQRIGEIRIYIKHFCIGTATRSSSAGHTEIVGIDRGPGRRRCGVYTSPGESMRRPWQCLLSSPFESFVVFVHPAEVLWRDTAPLCPVVSWLPEP